MIRDNESPTSWIIISDVHLGGFSRVRNEQIREEFENLIDHIADLGYGLIINGDLFDYYMEYQGSVPAVAEYGIGILQRYLHKTGQKPIVITGNHDNWDNGYLNSKGCEVIHEELQINIGKDRVLIAHGDGLEDPSFGLPRPRMHRVLRNPEFVRFFKSLTTVRTGNFIMKWFSRLNRIFDSGNEATTLRIDNWASSMLASNDVDVVLAAHHHNPRYIKFSNKLYLNSGCFYTERTAIRYTNNRFELVRWDNQTQTFIPYNSGNSDT